MKARDAMIEGNMALVVYRVETFLRVAPQMTYYRDDMISEGLVGLCKAVDAMQAKGPIEDPRPTGYITRSVDQHIARLVDEANTIVVSSRTQQRARTEGKWIKPPRTVSETAAFGVHDATARDRDLVAELEEEINACCRSDVEKQIVRLRAQGYTDPQINSFIGTSRRHISRQRAAIFKRFNNRCPELKPLRERIAERKEQEND